MARIFKHDCPHCGTKNVAFEMINSVKLLEDAVGWHIFATCGHCGWCVVALFVSPPHLDPKEYYVPDDKICLIRVWPDPTWGLVPDHLPENVARFFQQGLDGIGGSYDSAGAMFRKALDVGLKVRFPEITGTLFKRIEQAVEQSCLTKELGEWAHHIRLEGNDATHDDDPYTEEEARNLHVFTDLVMRYLFTLPGMLADRRNKPEPATTD